MWNKGFLKSIEVGKLIEQQLPKTISSKKIVSIEHEEFTTDEWYYIEALQNCREQGITIWIPNTVTFYVCVNRHGSNIGFYYGDHTFHGVSKDAYERGFQSFSSVNNCADVIVLHIKAVMDL